MAVYKNRDIQMAARTPYHHNNKQTNKYHYPLHEINQSKRNESSHKGKGKVRTNKESVIYCLQTYYNEMDIRN